MPQALGRILQSVSEKAEHESEVTVFAKWQNFGVDEEKFLH